MLLQISVSIAAIAFVVLVYFMIQTLKAANESLERASSTLENVQRTIESLNADLQAVARNANEVTASIQHQMSKLEPITDSMQHAGEALNEVTLAVKEVSVGFAHGLRGKAVVDKRQDSGRPQQHRAMSSSPMGTMESASTPTPQQASCQPNWYSWVDAGVQVWKVFRAVNSKS
ncbi:DUF948 domain-containing protein [Paenibacillus sp. SC116]|uniref:DUF948 domain-containing protein n=1 Tax=Paenibacillus sp. SC116 TaxID=2968986 RepID=UPI00215A44EB|nr:DUF948 domain-containing protein [Paenibacillus sp. SC116]MCR8846313.1 DUF948 domain-containing protein [Paenibacillus sp. SC116]